MCMSREVVGEWESEDWEWIVYYEVVRVRVRYCHLRSRYKRWLCTSSRNSFNCCAWLCNSITASFSRDRSFLVDNASITWPNFAYFCSGVCMIAGPVSSSCGFTFPFCTGADPSWPRRGSDVLPSYRWGDDKTFFMLFPDTQSSSKSVWRSDAATSIGTPASTPIPATVASTNSDAITGVAAMALGPVNLE